MSSLRVASIAGLCFSSVANYVSPAQAEDSVPIPAVVAKSALSDDNEEFDPRSSTHPAGALLGGWSPGPARWFMSAQADVGFMFLRPTASFGYGRPHDHWAGIDVFPIFSSGQAGLYSGIRYRHPRFEFRTGALYSYSLNHSYLEQKEHYDAHDLEILNGNHAEYIASDSEIIITIPIRKFYFALETQAIFLTGVPQSHFVFVDTLGAVVAPPASFRQLLAAGYAVPGVPGLFVAPAAESVWAPGREQPWVIRAGAIVVFSMYQDLELRTDILPTVWSPDDLGREGSSWLEVNLRFRWATN